MGPARGGALVLGALVARFVPESVVLGLSLLGGGAVSTPFLVAVFIPNVPEGSRARRA